MNQTNKSQTLYRCPKHIVAVVRKRRVKRNPPHGYPCIALVMRAANGTRVQMTPNGQIDYMPKYDEIKAFLIATDARFAEILPAWMRNKPIERERFYDARNAKRHAAK